MEVRAKMLGETRVLEINTFPNTLRVAPVPTAPIPTDPEVP